MCVFVSEWEKDLDQRIYFIDPVSTTKSPPPLLDGIDYDYVWLVNFFHYIPRDADKSNFYFNHLNYFGSSDRPIKVHAVSNKLVIDFLKSLAVNI